MNHNVIVIGKARKYLGIIKAIFRYQRSIGIHDMDMQELYDAGYRQSEPHWGLIDGASIDRSICTESQCDNCGHHGMDYKPFIREEPRSYRAFSICPSCGSSFEF